MAEYSENTTEPEKIDLLHIIGGAFQGFKKTWYIGLIFMLLGGALFYFRAYRSYSPTYTATVDMVVSSESNSGNAYTSAITLDQLSNTFPYILTSGALQDVVKEDLGLDYMPASISASVLEDTSIFQIRASGGDPEMVYKVLQSVINNYSEVAQYIIGTTYLEVLDDTGVPTTPDYTPDFKRIAAKGVVYGLALYIAILLLFAGARKTVNRSEDLKRFTQVKYMGGLPENHTKHRRRDKKENKALLFTSDTCDNSFKEALNTLSIRLERYAEKNEQKTFVFTSAGKDEGKTTICVNLAMSLARKGNKVILLDGDLRNPSVGRVFGIEAEKGVVDILKEECTFGEALRTEENGLMVIPGGKPVSGSAGLLKRNRFRRLIEEASEKADYVFVDAAPAGFMQDTSLIAGETGNVIMIIRQDYSLRNKILECMEMLTDTGAKMAGYIINREKTGIGSYGYGKYGYGKYGYGRYGHYGYGKYGYGKYAYGEDAEKGKDDR